MSEIRNGTKFPIQFDPFNITISLKYTYNKEINIHFIRGRSRGPGREGEEEKLNFYGNYSNDSDYRNVDTSD